MQVTKQNYFDLETDRAYMSNSQFKGFMNCEAKQMAILDGSHEKTSTPAMLLGKYVHAWNEDDLENFKSLNPEIYTQKGELKSEFKNANEIIEIIKSSPLFMEVLSGQKEVIFTAEMFGATWKVLIDSYLPEKNRFADLKVMAKLRDKCWDEALSCYVTSYENYGYWVQMAVYAEVERIANGRNTHLEPFIAVVTKEAYPDKAIISFVGDSDIPEAQLDHFLDVQLKFVEFNMPRILAVKSGTEKARRCEACDYCRKSKILTRTMHYSEFNLY